jgi:hypothetical protein
VSRDRLPLEPHRKLEEEEKETVPLSNELLEEFRFTREGIPVTNRHSEVTPEGHTGQSCYVYTGRREAHVKGNPSDKSSLTAWPVFKTSLWGSSRDCSSHAHYSLLVSSCLFALASSFGYCLSETFPSFNGDCPGLSSKAVTVPLTFALAFIATVLLGTVIVMYFFFMNDLFRKHVFAVTICCRRTSLRRSATLLQGLGLLAAFSSVCVWTIGSSRFVREFNTCLIDCDTCMFEES